MVKGTISKIPKTDATLRHELLYNNKASLGLILYSLRKMQFKGVSL